MTESEALVWAAATVAKEESAAAAAAPNATIGAASADIVVIHIKIKGVGEWILDSTGDVRVPSTEDTLQANLHLTYASDEVFVGLAHR